MRRKKGLSLVPQVIITTVVVTALGSIVAVGSSGPINDGLSFSQSQIGKSGCQTSFNRIGGGQEFFEQNPNCRKYADELRSSSQSGSPPGDSDGTVADCDASSATKFVEGSFPAPGSQSDATPLDASQNYTFEASSCVPTRNISIWYKEANGTCQNDGVSCWSRAATKQCDFEKCSVAASEIDPVRSVSEGATGYHPYIFKANITDQGELSPAEVEYENTHVCTGSAKFVDAPSGTITSDQSYDLEAVSCEPASIINLRVQNPPTDAESVSERFVEREASEPSYRPPFVSSECGDGLCSASGSVSPDEDRASYTVGVFTTKGDGSTSSYSREWETVNCNDANRFSMSLPETLWDTKTYNPSLEVCNSDGEITDSEIDVRVAECGVGGVQCGSVTGRELTTFTVSSESNVDIPASDLPEIVPPDISTTENPRLNEIPDLAIKYETDDGSVSETDLYDLRQNDPIQIESVSGLGTTAGPGEEEPPIYTNPPLWFGVEYQDDDRSQEVEAVLALSAINSDLGGTYTAADELVYRVDEREGVVNLTYPFEPVSTSPDGSLTGSGEGGRELSSDALQRWIEMNQIESWHWAMTLYDVNETGSRLGTSATTPTVRLRIDES